MTMKAYSLLTVKTVDEEKRVITGIASTPVTDRVGDIVVSTGAKFATPMPLLLYHDHNLPVGQVVFAKATKEGIPFTATIPIVPEAGTIRDRVDEAWHSVKYKLIGAVSIGFRALKDGVELMTNGGLRFTAWEWLELSLVTVPANPEAVIQSFKSLDTTRILDAIGATAGGDDERREIIKTIDREHLPSAGLPVVALIQAPGKGPTKLTPQSRGAVTLSKG